MVNEASGVRIMLHEEAYNKLRRITIALLGILLEDQGTLEVRIPEAQFIHINNRYMLSQDYDPETHEVILSLLDLTIDTVNVNGTTVGN